MSAESRDDTMQMLLYLGIGVAVYYFWKQFSAGVSTITAPAVSAAANAWVAMTSGPGVVPAGGIVLPSGQVVPVSSVTPHAQNDGSTTVNVAGTTYTILPGVDDDGNWQAVSD